MDCVKIDLLKCCGADACTKVCPTNALSLENGKAKVDPDLCAGCGVCVEACPNQALSL